MTARHHLIIAGTGRAGTSFLVRYLTALGLDTTLSRHGEAGNWSEAANAGLENHVLADAADQASYVLKSPWAGEYFDQILARRDIVIDALVLPVRDLVDASTSRSILEHQALHHQHGWMANDLDQTWEVFGWTPGGSVFSLNPLDQARLLAVSFHRMIHKAVENEIPLVMPAFPRMVEDWSYLYRIMKPVLPETVTPEQARAAHESIASPSLVRVEDERSEQRRSSPLGSNAVAPIVRYPSLAEIDNIALRREIKQVRMESDLHKAKAEQLALQSSLPPASSGLPGRRRRFRRIVLATRDAIWRGLRARSPLRYIGGLCGKRASAPLVH